jgi:hypothetical protein
MSGMDDEVSLSDGAASGLADLTDDIVLEMTRPFHQKLSR